MGKQTSRRQSQERGPRARRAAAIRPYWVSRTAVGVSAILPVLVAIVFVQTVGFPFVNLDDNEYVFENPHVAGGFSPQGIVWAFTEMRRAGHWHPLTWLSLMLDGQLYGIEHPGGFHFTNVLLHAANAIVLFLLLREMTGGLWPSAFVAAVFAVHPAHVESVAWVTERKDVLSGLFGLLAIWAYARYARTPSVARYLAVAAALALGLMAKPMLVTWPLVFLLLDYWPLRRRLEVGLFLEKLPLLVLVAASAAVTIVAQRFAGAVVPVEWMPMPARICRAAVLYCDYLGKTFWPLDLAAYSGYSRDVHSGLRSMLGAAALLTLLTAVALWGAWRGWRWLAVGWLWFLGTLLPTIGLLQVGAQVEADRFLYLPQIGLCVAVAWSVAYALRSWLVRYAGGGRAAGCRSACATAALLIVAGLAACGWRQTAYWADNVSLWTYSLRYAEGSYLLHYNLANSLADRGRMAEAVDQYRKALAIKPDYVDAYSNLGAALAHCGQLDAAIASFRAALAINPNLAAAHGNLGVALLRRGRAGDAEEAIEHFRRELLADPNDATAYNALGVGLLQTRKFDEAIDQFQTALRINPGYTEARRNLELARANQK